MVSGVGTSYRGQWQVTLKQTSLFLVNLRHLTDSAGGCSRPTRVLAGGRLSGGAPSGQDDASLVADAPILDGRLEPGRRRGWNVYTGCGDSSASRRMMGIRRRILETHRRVWGLVGESADDGDSSANPGDSSESLEASV